MTTAEERMRILQMIQEGKVTAEEGTRLLEALGSSRPATPTPARDPRLLRVRITDLATGKTKVNVNIPMSLVTVGIKLGARFTPHSANVDYDEILEAIRGGAVASVKKRLSSVPILLVDDVHSLAGKNQIQEEFFSLFTSVLGRGGQVILSSDRPPKEIPRFQQRLVSRFESGTMIELKKPALSTRLAILGRKAKRLGLSLPRPILMLLASEIRSNIRRMEGAVNRLAAQATIGGGIPGREAVEALLRNDLLGGDAQAVTTRGIQQRVASHFQLRTGTLLGPSRSGRVVFPRHLAMYLCRRLVNSPYADIGAAFSGRDHTTVMHACAAVEELLRRNGDARELVDRLITAIRS